MGLLRRELFIAALVVGLGGCLFASMRNDAPATASLTSARIQAATAAPCLPILVLRTARDDIGLPDIDHSNVKMIVDAAELDAKTLDRSRAALLEGLARGVEANDFDETLIALLTDQMSWAAAEIAPRMQKALDQLYEVLTPEQRRAVVARVETRLPSWARTWASDPGHRWLEAWAERDTVRELPGFSDDLVRTSRTWGEESVAHVRLTLPHLDPAQRRALAASLRTGLPE